MSHADHDSPRPQTAPLGVQLYSVRDDIGPDELSGTLSRLAAMGFTHVEPYRILDNTDRLAAALDEAGLLATAAHANVVTAERDDYLAAARRLGLGTLIVPWTEPGRLRDRDGVTAVAGAINDAARRAADQGIRVGYHNHDFEFGQHVDGVPAYEILADALEESVVLEVDTHWASVGGADVFELLPRLGDRVRFLHVTNEPSDDDDPPVLGVDITGRMDEVIAAGRGTGAMTVLEVVVHEGDIFPVLERNAAFFRKLVDA
ncbi:MAG: sugar phosphate isomerase/epimerase family protein [Trebonia sp.]